MQPTLTIESPWSLKDPFLIPRKETRFLVNLGPPQYLVTDRGTEYINQDSSSSRSF